MDNNYIFSLNNLSITDLKEALSNLDSEDLVNYLINLNKEDKDIILEKIETVLGKDYVRFLNEVMNYKSALQVSDTKNHSASET